jgi:hypothetical protein
MVEAPEQQTAEEVAAAIATAVRDDCGGPT